MFDIFCKINDPKVSEVTQIGFAEYWGWWKCSELLGFLPSDGVQTSSEHSRSDITSRGSHTGYGCPVVRSNVVHLNRVQVRNAVKTAYYIDVVVEQSNAGPWTEHIIFLKDCDTRLDISYFHFLPHLNALWPWVSHWSSDLCEGHIAPLSSGCSDRRIHLWGYFIKETDAKWNSLPV